MTTPKMLDRILDPAYWDSLVQLLVDGRVAKDSDDAFEMLLGTLIDYAEDPDYVTALIGDIVIPVH